MVTLDETDIGILGRLGTNARQPYNAIADDLGVTPPTISGRVKQLKEEGVIDMVTTVDYHKLEADQYLVELEVSAEKGDRVVEQLAQQPSVNRVYRSLESRVVAIVVTHQTDPETIIFQTIQEDLVEEYSINLVVDSETNHEIAWEAASKSCDACEKTLIQSPEVITVDEDEKYACDSDCADALREKHAPELD